MLYSGVELFKASILFEGESILTIHKLASR